MSDCNACNSIFKIDIEKLDRIIELAANDENYKKGIGEIKQIAGNDYIRIETPINSIVTTMAEKMYLCGLKDGLNILRQIDSLL